jgi:hypothetical protein
VSTCKLSPIIELKALTVAKMECGLREHGGGAVGFPLESPSLTAPMRGHTMSSTETIINAETTDASTPHSKDLICPLGAGEELMWLLDLSSRVHFALAAEVEGRTTVEEWRVALDALQRRHPLLYVCIDSNHIPIPHFRSRGGRADSPTCR